MARDPKITPITRHEPRTFYATRVTRTRAGESWDLWAVEDGRRVGFMSVIDDGHVVFKAEIGAVSDLVCQVQGVWVAPELRGQGLCAPGMSAVVALSRLHHTPVVSLYVNDFNTVARRVYERVGFRTHGDFATVLF